MCGGGFPTNSEKTNDNKKVKDHCHYTGNFRGAAHNFCNLRCRKPNFIPVIFHNLAGYDSHLFIIKLSVKYKTAITSGCEPPQECDEISCIASNEEKYITFSKRILIKKYFNKKNEVKRVFCHIRFIDSIKFMAEGLNNLAKNLDKNFSGEDLIKNIPEDFNKKILKII